MSQQIPRGRETSADDELVRVPREMLPNSRKGDFVNIEGFEDRCKVHGDQMNSNGLFVVVRLDEFVWIKRLEQNEP